MILVSHICSMGSNSIQIKSVQLAQKVIKQVSNQLSQAGTTNGVESKKLTHSWKEMPSHWDNSNPGRDVKEN